VVDEEVGTSLLTDMLTAVTQKADKEGHPYLSVVVAFARSCSEDLTGIIPRSKQYAMMRKFQMDPPKSQVAVKKSLRTGIDYTHKYAFHFTSK
jgi:hypothetical protein